MSDNDLAKLSGGIADIHKRLDESAEAASGLANLLSGDPERLAAAIVRLAHRNHS